MADEVREDWGERTVGAVVAEDYRRGAVFKRFGIDFCCGGGRSVRAACEQAGADYDAVARALSDAGEARGAVADDPVSWQLDALAAHIVSVHHAYVRESLPVLGAFATKVARVHGERHPELRELRDLVEALSGELERHMREEEEVLFPRIAALSAAGTGAADEIRTATGPLEDDHDRAGELMRRIRTLSDDFTPPADACTTYRATFAKLAEFEEDLHRHVHLENNVLFPRAAALEEELTAAGPAA